MNSYMLLLNTWTARCSCLTSWRPRRDSGAGAAGAAAAAAGAFFHNTVEQHHHHHSHHHHHHEQKRKRESEATTRKEHKKTTIKPETKREQDQQWVREKQATTRAFNTACKNRGHRRRKFPLNVRTTPTFQVASLFLQPRSQPAPPVYD